MRTVLDYRRYATFSWDWSWRRSVLFAIFGVLFGAWVGAIVGLALENRHFDFAIALRSSGTLIVSRCAGPLAASWIRSRGWPRRQEMAGVVAAVILGSLVAEACNGYGHRLLVTRSLSAGAASHPMAVRAIASPPFPGAHTISETRALFFKAQTSACSRPPPPITRIFISKT